MNFSYNCCCLFLINENWEIVIFISLRNSIVYFNPFILTWQTWCISKLTKFHDQKLKFGDKKKKYKFAQLWGNWKNGRLMWHYINLIIKHTAIKGNWQTSQLKNKYVFANTKIFISKFSNTGKRKVYHQQTSLLRVFVNITFWTQNW